MVSNCAAAPDWSEKHREIPRHDPQGIVKVIRVLCYLLDSGQGNRAEIKRELAFVRKHRHRMRNRAFKEQGIAMGSGVVEVANIVFVTQRMKRNGMHWRITGGQAVLTFRSLIKSGYFDRVLDAIITILSGAANNNTRSNEVQPIAA